MAGEQPSDDQDAAASTPPAPPTGPNDDAPQLPTDPIDPAATPLPAGTPPFPPVVPPPPPPATADPIGTTSAAATPAAGAASPEAAIPAAGTASPAAAIPAAATPAAATPAVAATPLVAAAGASTDAADDPSADDDLTSKPGHTIRTLLIAIVALVVLLGIGLLAMQKFGDDESPRPPANAATSSAAPAEAAPTAPVGAAITVKVTLVTSTDDASPCPATARLMGTITVASGPTDVTYRWTHSDGRDSDIRTVRVDGSAQVTQEWAHPGRTSFLGQTQLEVITPEVAKSTTMTIRGGCTPGGSPSPASPSPSPSH